MFFFVTYLRFIFECFHRKKIKPQQKSRPFKRKVMNVAQQKKRPSRYFFVQQKKIPRQKIVPTKIKEINATKMTQLPVVCARRCAVPIALFFLILRFFHR
eukprot:GEMP01083660.1.p1 GENE.GEMP01083660.1~~GEMP01083660.1.p1  ORF type:complete len:100 (-),score=1.17 GEMP01083660.1:157-456(-)